MGWVFHGTVIHVTLNSGSMTGGRRSTRVTHPGDKGDYVLLASGKTDPASYAELTRLMRSDS